MFFSRNITTIFITGGKIRAAVFSSDGKNVKEEKSYDWTAEGLIDVLKDIAARGPAQSRVVFGEEFSYVTVLRSGHTEREIVLKEAQEVIPELLEHNWDFCQGKNLDFSPQVAAIKPELLDVFMAAFQQAGLVPEAVEPQSIAMARLLRHSGEAFFAVRDEKVLIGSVRDGVIVAAQVIKPEHTVCAFEHLISYVRKKSSLSPKKVFINDQINPEAEVFSKNGLDVEVMRLDPLASVAMKKHLTGDDSRVMNILRKPGMVLKRWYNK